VDEKNPDLCNRGRVPKRVLVLQATIRQLRGICLYLLRLEKRVIPDCRRWEQIEHLRLLKINPHLRGVSLVLLP
jgi:hypothetical protein